MKIFLAIIAFITSSFIFLTSRVSPVTPGPTATPTETSTPSAVPTRTPIITVHRPKPTAPATVAPTTTPNSNINDYIYPGSQIISSSITNLSLQSSDSADSITNWYQARVNSGFSSRADSITNINGNVSGNISASNDTQNVTITIRKSAGELYTFIKIVIKSP